MEFAVVERDAQSDDRKAGRAAAGHGLFDAVSHGIDELARDRPTDDRVDELEGFVGLDGFHLQVHHRELAVSAGLLLQSTFAVASRTNRFVVLDVGRRSRHVHVESTSQPFQRDLQVRIAHGVNHQVARHRVVAHAQCRRRCLGRHRCQVDTTLGEDVAHGDVVEFGDHDHVAGHRARHRNELGAEEVMQSVQALVVPGAHVDERDVGRDRAGDHLHHHDATDVGVDDDLEGPHDRLAVRVAVEERFVAVHHRALGQRRDRSRDGDLVEQRGETIDPDAQRGRTAGHRHDATFDHHLGERRLEFVHRGHVALEVTLGQRIVSDDDGLDQTGADPRFQFGQFRGYRGVTGRGAVIEDGLVGQEVDDALQRRSYADWQF